MTIACNRLMVLSFNRRFCSLLLLDDAESNSMSESLSFGSGCDVELVQSSFGEHFAESSSISKLSSSSKGLLNFWRSLVFVVRLQFSSESTLSRPYAFRGGRWLFLSAKKRRREKKHVESRELFKKKNTSWNRKLTFLLFFVNFSKECPKCTSKVKNSRLI